MGTLRVGGVTPLTTIDYPGELAAVVFCQGCPWRCRYCHNAHLLDAGNPGLIPWPEVLAFLERRRGLLDAVVFSGGEPLAQGGLSRAMASVKGMGFRVGLHTAGCYPERLERVLPVADWVGLDIKALPEDYPATTGAAGSGGRAWESLRLLVAAGARHEIRITVHETLLDSARLRALVARLVAAGAAKVALQRCDPGHAVDPTLGPASTGWMGDYDRGGSSRVFVRH